MNSVVDLYNRFKYHRPKGDQHKRYQELRQKTLALAKLYDRICPPSREKDKAFSHLEMAVMWANASIARNE